MHPAMMERLLNLKNDMEKDIFRLKERIESLEEHLGLVYVDDPRHIRESEK